ncbi:hypothetical protein [Psychroserpens luteus]|jgi:hypothetical protein|uniref:Lipocalin-like domain-containing protein n=1 Tax=Psychroserpens luteus TaxID=1434066 RepID=A0ABW5ZMN4_9FLAO|nr:hypothetical protein [Psychroserpens luteus]
MNKSLKLLLLLFISVNTLYAQNTKELDINIENLSKKWEIIGVINPDVSAEELEETLSMLESTYLLLNKDSTYVFSFIMELEGKWQLKDNVIHTKDNRGENKWIIHSLEENSIILSRNQAKQKLVFKPKK